jgi:hypothetical protein
LNLRPLAPEDTVDDANGDPKTDSEQGFSPYLAPDPGARQAAEDPPNMDRFALMVALVPKRAFSRIPLGC